MKRVFVTGVGCIIGSVYNEKAYTLSDDQFNNEILNQKVKNIDRISKICIASAQLALRDAGIGNEIYNDDFGIVFGTACGPLKSIHEFDSVSVEKGALHVNPSAFPNTVLNSPAYYTSIHFGISGPVFTICNGIISSLDAIGIGYLQLKNGTSSKILAGGGDEISALQLAVHNSNKTIVESCGFILLEGHEHFIEKKLAFELVDYRTFTINNISEIYKYIVDNIILILYKNDIPFYYFNKLHIYSSLKQDIIQVISKEIKKYLHVDIDTRVEDMDYMGAGGIIQICKSIRESNNCPYNGSINIILNVDINKVSILALKTIYKMNSNKDD